MSMCFERVIRGWSVEELQAANASPILFAYLFVELLAFERMHTYTRSDPLEKLRYEAFHGRSDWIKYDFQSSITNLEESLLYHRDSLELSIDNISHFEPEGFVNWSEHAIAVGNEMIRDWGHLHGLIKKRLHDFHTLESRYIAYRGAISALDSTNQAQSLARLTFIAFLFIPLTFVSTLFGMNLQNLGTGTASVKSFVIACITVLSSTAIIFCIATAISRYLALFRHRLGGVVAKRKTLRNMASVTLIGTFWLVLFGLLHDYAEFEFLLDELGILEILEKYYLWESPKIVTPNRTITLTPFWERRAMAIAEITRSKGWYKRSFRRSRRRESHNEEAIEDAHGIARTPNSQGNSEGVPAATSERSPIPEHGTRRTISNTSSRTSNEFFHESRRRKPSEESERTPSARRRLSDDMRRASFERERQRRSPNGRSQSPQPERGVDGGFRPDKRSRPKFFAEKMPSPPETYRKLDARILTIPIGNEKDGPGASSRQP